mmetsp:Transcript_6664/g.18692  ORF Transcript_6664/g.18692 Transcript_6664/m.18692 type:complete len:658 (-) Transcript_6664:23-1996(-)
MPRSRDRSSRDRRRSRDDSDDEDIDEVWRAGTTKPRSRRHDRTARSAEYDEFLRTRPAPAPTLSPRDKNTRSSWDLAAFASHSVDVDWDADPREERRRAPSAGWATRLAAAQSHGGRAREHDLTEKLKTFGFFDDFDVAADTVNDGDYYASDSLVAEARRRLRKTDPSKKDVTTVKDDKIDPRNLSDIATDLDAALGTLTQRLSCTDLLPEQSQAYETPLYDATPSTQMEMKGPQTLSQISETLDAALYTFTKSYQAKEAAEKAAQEEIEKQRGLERAEIEKEIRAKHSLELMEAAIALGECDSKIEGERRDDDAYLGPIRDMRRSLDGEEPLPPARRAATLNDSVFHYPPSQPQKVPFLPLGAMGDTSLPPPVPRVEQRPTGSLNDVSQGIGAELDLALGLMQKRLGAEQMVAKDGDVKPDAKPKVMEDPESKGELDEDEKKRLMRKEIEEFEKRVDDAEKAATARREQQVDDLGSDCSSEPRDEPGDLGLGGARAHRFETEESIDRFLAAGPARPPRIVDVAARPRSVERPQPLRGSFERYDGGALQSRRSYERRSRSPPRTYERRSRSPPRTYERRSRSPRVSYPQSPFADLANIYDAARDRHERVSYKRDDRVRVVEERATEADLSAAERLERVKTLRETVRKDLRGYEDGTA